MRLPLLSAALLVVALIGCDAAGPAPTVSEAKPADGEGSSGHRQGKVAVCHYDDETATYKRISVGAPALSAHLARHPDGVPGGEVPGADVPSTFDDDCAVVPRCATELNPVFFGYGSTTLSADARARLDENIEVLRRCPDICVTINAYSDGSEPGDAMRISQNRADAVRDYYVSQGIDADRLRAVGLGVDPAANPDEDPGPGDSRARRAESIPSSCAGF